LISEFCGGETPDSKEYVKGRPIVASRYNFYHHMGKISSLRKEVDNYLGCYQELLFPVVFEIEAFNPKQCPNDDIWPCNVDENLKIENPSIIWKK
jgi:hypothetical protein